MEIFMKELIQLPWLISIYLIFMLLLSANINAEQLKGYKQLTSYELEQQDAINKYLLDPQNIKEFDNITSSNNRDGTLKTRSYKDSGSSTDKDMQNSDK